MSGFVDRAVMAFGVFFVCVMPLPAMAEDFIGTWLTEQGEAHIRVERCAKQMCGTIVWLRDAIDPKTKKPQVDDKNPNPGLRARPIVGLRIFAMDLDATDSWTGPRP